MTVATAPTTPIAPPLKWAGGKRWQIPALPTRQTLPETWMSGPASLFARFLAWLGRETPESHYAAWDAGGAETVPALCGVRIRRRDHDEYPSCPSCIRQKARLARRAV